MAYDEELAVRIRSALAGLQGVTERKMFGGLGFMVNGHMCCGVTPGDLMLRLGPEGATAALSEPHTRPMDFTGKPIKSMIYVESAGIRGDAALKAWLDRAVTFAQSLPPK